MTAVSVPAGEAPLGSLIVPEPDERRDASGSPLAGPVAGIG